MFPEMNRINQQIANMQNSYHMSEQRSQNKLLEDTDKGYRTGLVGNHLEGESY